MANEAKYVIKDELMLGEEIIWCGQPNKSKIFSKSDAFLVPFSLFWGGFAIVWTILATKYEGSFGIIGIPFIIIGIYFIVGRFFAKRYNKNHTYYAITNSRILIVKTDLNEDKVGIVSAKVDMIEKESCVTDKNGVGTITFGQLLPSQAIYLNTGLEFLSGLLNGDNNVVAFVDIEDCDEVLSLYRKVREGTYESSGEYSFL